MRLDSRAVPTIGALLLVTSSGCATILHGQSAPVKFDSFPEAAHVTIRDPKGVEVANAQTPAVVALPRGRTCFRPAKYTATFSKPGYKTAQVPMKSKINPWVAGNVIFGGIPGLVVDSATGAGWEPKSAEIAQSLTPLGEQQMAPQYDEAVEVTSANVTDADKRSVNEAVDETPMR